MVRGEPSVMFSRLGGSARTSASGWRTPARRNRSSSVAAMPMGRPPSPRIMDIASWLEILLPPGFRQIAEQRGPRGMLDSGPARHPLHWREVERHHIEARQKHPVECARGRDKICSRRGAEHRGYHSVDRLRFDAHVIAAALLVGGGRAPIEQLLVAGRK